MRRFWNWIKRIFRKKPVMEAGNDTVPITITREISKAGLLLIIHFEGFYSKPYLDSAGVPTIGYGTIRYKNGRKVTMDDPAITKQEAMDELMYEVNQKCKGVQKVADKYGVKLSQNEFDALCSFAYNVGVGRITNYKSTVNKGFRYRRKDIICEGMMLYTKAGGRTLRGLVRRRKAEVAMFKGEDYGKYIK